MKLKDYVKAGFGVSIGFILGEASALIAVKLVRGTLEILLDKPEPEKEAKIETGE